ncbi:2-amino-4-hydroxy-6-hydroxymethyldihydropteridine diphosphokinase [Denitrificimonas sp. JX-1]|uniref:2-amino-4-hydroxy-6-hydroxymethyldihydropteridine diphosphokinase n=1 Tax=Denitrificimonas halotolerans TaxID=3098930 RepID=A0ABU5GVT7_9GAMM|nr:2-amino-4-hydroxy-6-hydroxymethyldihydropteridine diphosphokinase [Denitrificimonas sp. JX-1]MDY7219748.1 2-amino-4-hydroxy-6-hydroxymethyldihydropteridine diphosphokinase [Denitrificimonas sp. JX-1]
MSLVDVYLGLGSNIEREAHLCAGLDALFELFGELRCSPVFESEPVGIRSDCFLNLVVHFKTAMPLQRLNQHLKQIESINGRYAQPRRGLTLDIDVLLYEQHVGVFGDVILPRAEILKNAFVLWPLSILAPQVLHPVEQCSFLQLWQQTPIEQNLWPHAFVWRGQDLTPVHLLKASAV